MSSLDIAASPSIRRDETVLISLLLAFAGGYLDAYTWIIHGVMANAQAANLVLLWVHGSVGEWDRAAQFVPPMAACMVGIIVAVGILHNRLPALAGTLGISFVAAMQTAVLTKVEGVAYSSVMITGNTRQAVEGVFTVVSGQSGSLRRPGIFAALCITFGMGAAVGAYATKVIPDLALGLPVVALLVVLRRCETRRNEDRR